MDRPIDSIDTAVAYGSESTPLLHMTNDGLVGFDRVSGLLGTQLVPDLATSLPSPSDGGKNYTFQLRPNIRYSNGKALKASDFRYTFERDFRIGKLPVSYYDDIVGATRCEKRPKHCNLSQGIVTDNAGRTSPSISSRPTPSSSYKLALPFASVVPSGTQLRETSTAPLPATGPYMISSYQPNHFLTLVRNPFFHEWSKAAQPDALPRRSSRQNRRHRRRSDQECHPGTSGSRKHLVGRNVLAASRCSDQDPASGSGAHEPVTSDHRLLPQHPSCPVRPAGRPPSGELRSDRSKAVQLSGGPDLAQTTCQILPPDFPGYQPYCPFTANATKRGGWTAPNLAKARALVARSGTAGMRVTFWSWAPFGGFGPYAVQLLQSLGYPRP